MRLQGHLCSEPTPHRPAVSVRQASSTLNTLGRAREPHQRSRPLGRKHVSPRRPGLELVLTVPRRPLPSPDVFAIYRRINRKDALAFNEPIFRSVSGLPLPQARTSLSTSPLPLASPLLYQGVDHWQCHQPHFPRSGWISRRMFRSSGSNVYLAMQARGLASSNAQTRAKIADSIG